jgi:hypothetical protein
MSSCDSILKWAKEAKVLLRQGDTAAVRTNLSMIVSQAKEEVARQKKEKK